MLLTIIILSATVVGLAIILYQEKQMKDRNLAEWKKWEAEYWLVRSYASKHYYVHLSWVPRGTDACIKSKGNE